ncbi:MAG: hypothetical protein NTX30_07015 [Deltaproteobacteria bacterium]|nr:hypothetical protein [Deltaproteobacteria bacterium]
MDKQKKPSKKEEAGVSLNADAFLKEVEDNFEAWSEDATPALARMGSLSSGLLERVFSSLVKNKAEEIYPFFQSILGREEKIDLPLADSLGRWNSPEAGILLQRLAEKSSSRAVLKNVRKSIFRLKSQGLEVDEIRDVSPAVFHPGQPIPAEGFLSALDGAGTRMVWLVRPQPPRGVAAFHALITDSQGIMDFQAFETSRKKFHEYVEEFRKQAPWEIVEADPEYCLGLMIEASELHSKKGETPPGDFLKWKTLMGSPPAMPLRPLIHLYLKEEEWKNRSDLLDRTGSLFENPSFQIWYLEEEEARKYLTLVKEASESRLVLTPYQKEGRVMEIYRQAVEELFTRERRAIFRRRLEEMAFVLWKTGKENEAQMSFVAALGMETEGGILSIHPFLLELVKRSLTALLEEEAKKQSKESDLLIKP